MDCYLPSPEIRVFAHFYLLNAHTDSSKVGVSSKMLSLVSLFPSSSANDCILILTVPAGSRHPMSDSDSSETTHINPMNMRWNIPDAAPDSPSRGLVPMSGVRIRKARGSDGQQ